MRDLPGVGLLSPPHVSLGYPWLPPDAALAALPDVSAAAASVPAFEALLSGPYAFTPDPRGRVVVHARLSPSAPVRALAAALQADLREVHLSLARVTRDGSVDAVLGALAPLLPLAVRISVLEVSVRPAGGVWSVVLQAPLG